MELSFRFVDKRSGHNDLILQLGDASWVCDSYYLALDRGLLPDIEDVSKVRAVLQRLHEQWLSAVEALPDGGTAYLPYDFSDEYTAWLACKRSGSTVAVTRGWAKVEGWSFYPSEAGDLITCPRGFQLDGPTVTGALAELQETIRRSLHAV